MHWQCRAIIEYEHKDFVVTFARTIENWTQKSQTETTKQEAETEEENETVARRIDRHPYCVRDKMNY